VVVQNCQAPLHSVTCERYEEGIQEAFSDRIVWNGGSDAHCMAGASPQAWAPASGRYSAPAVDYWKHTIEVKKGVQVERMKRVRIFNPLHVLANKISVFDVEGLKILKLSQHPQIMLQIEVMKTEVIKYQTLADSIKPHVERKDVKGNDTFDISDWWKANCAMLPAFTYVLRAVLTNSPNSCPPERLFSIFNSTFDADQSRSYADYTQLSMQSQFNR